MAGLARSTSSTRTKVAGNSESAGKVDGSGQKSTGRLPTAAAAVACRRWVLPTPGGPHNTNPVSTASPLANRASAATASRLGPGRKLANVGGSGVASSKINCSISRSGIAAVKRRNHVFRAKVAQSDQQCCRDGQREQNAGEAEQLSERKQREDNGDGMQPDPVAHEPRYEDVVFKQLPDAVNREDCHECRPPAPLQQGCKDTQYKP